MYLVYECSRRMTDSSLSQTSALTYTENDPYLQVTSSITVTDVDVTRDALLDSAQVWISNNFDANGDVLAFDCARTLALYDG